jgi:hypothetical protein
MPQEPVLVYSTVDGEPAAMHSVDAAEATRLGDYTYASPKDAKDKDGAETPEHAAARGRAMARFMGGGLDQAELKSPEEREESRQRANEAEAKRMAPLVVGQGSPDAMASRSVASPKPQASRAMSDTSVSKP